MSEAPRNVTERLDELAEDFQALSHRNRLHLLRLLTRPRYGEELADALDTSRPNALNHVEKLEDCGFVRSMDGQRESGPVVEYQVVPQRLYALSVALQELGRLEPEGGPEISRSPATQQDEIGVPESPPRSSNGSGEGTALLRVMDGPEAGQALELGGEQSRWQIGRDEDLDLVLDHDPFVSGRHAEVHVAPSGHAIVDVYSSNGTHLNFSELPEGGRAELAPGDIVRVGHTRLVYQTP